MWLLLQNLPLLEFKIVYQGKFSENCQCYLKLSLPITYLSQAFPACIIKFNIVTHRKKHISIILICVVKHLGLQI